MMGMDKKSNKLILLMLLLPLAVVLIAAGCKKKDNGLYQFVITSATKSESVADSESMPSETFDTTFLPETTSEETTEETTEEESVEETTTKAGVKAETKKTVKATKPTVKKTTKKTTAKKKTTKKKTYSKPKYDSYLFVGDSRTVGLDEAVSGVSSIAKVGAGVNYLKSVIDDVTKVRGKNVIFNFGVNDLANYKEYLAVYKSLPKAFLKKNNVIIMSVNPTDGSKYKSWNTDIDKFNKYMKKYLPSGFSYLDTNSVLKKEGFETRDGCHYKPVTYRRIARLTFIFCGDKNRKP